MLLCTCVNVCAVVLSCGCVELWVNFVVKLWHCVDVVVLWCGCVGVMVCVSV